MSRKWKHEDLPTWDAAKIAIVGKAPPGAFPFFSGLERGDPLPGDWWRLEEAGAAVGYGWMELNWGDAEILLAVEPSRQGSGLGEEILDHLQDEARARGLNYMTNVVRATHPKRQQVSAWLEKRGFEKEGEYLRRRVDAVRG